MTLEEELLEREREFWDAAGNGDFYREHFADDGVCVFAMGVLDKDTTIDAIDQAEPWVEVALHDVRVIVLGDDTAALVYFAKARRAADEQPYEAHISSVFVRRHGDWMLTVHQQTPSA